MRRREKNIGSLIREVGGWAPVGPAPPARVLSSPPSVRPHCRPIPLSLSLPLCFSDATARSPARSLQPSSPAPASPPRTPVHSPLFSSPLGCCRRRLVAVARGFDSSRFLAPRRRSGAGGRGAASSPGSVERDRLAQPGLRGPCREQRRGLCRPGERSCSSSRSRWCGSLAEADPPPPGLPLRPPTAMAGSDEVNRNECKTAVPLSSFLLISNFKVAYNIQRRPDGTFDRDLSEFFDRRAPPNARPVEGVSSFDHVVDPSVGLDVRIYRPVANNNAGGGAGGAEGAAAFTLPILQFFAGAPSPDPFPVILFFHGGSFAHSTSSSTIYDQLCRSFVKLSMGVVVSVNYRRAPEHRYPCAYDDGWTALKWVMSQPSLRSGGVDAQPRVFLSGDSSGGNIAHHVAVRAADEGIDIHGNILLNAMFGGTERTESEVRLDGQYFVTLQDRDWYWKAYLPEDADRDHPACNPFGPNGRRVGGIPFTKSLIIVSGLDLTCDRQLAYAQGLEEDGHDVKLVYREMATIGFYLLPNTDHYHEVMEEIADFLEANL